MFIQNHDRTAVIEKGNEISYGELLRRIHFFASLYKIKKTDERVIICMENRLEWFSAFFSVWKNGGVPVPVDYLSSPDEIAYILKDCSPSCIFFSDETREKVEQAVTQSRKRAVKINVDSITDKSDSFPPDGLPALDNDKTAAIIYTSGTTGSPKGVMLSYDNFMANIESVTCDEALFYRKDQRVMVMLPLHHVFPLAGTMIVPLYLGATTVFCPAITGDAILKTLQSYDINMIVGVPRLYEMIGKGIHMKISENPVALFLLKLAGIIRSEKLSRILFKKVHEKFGKGLEWLISGGAPLDIRIARLFQTLGLRLVEGYGMTEAAPMISCPRPGHIKPGTVGYPIRETEVEIRDGEICFRGRNMMKGYYNRPEETAEIIKDGWLHTGDLGEFDKQGHLVITGRRKEIIVLPNGKNVNPVEIESAVESLSGGIEEAGVFEKDGRLHIIIRPDAAYIDSHEILNITEYFRADVIEKYNRSVAPYKRLTHIHLVSRELPRTRLQKLKRHRLEELIESRDDISADIEMPEFDEYHMLADYLKTESGREVKPDDHIEIDLGLDSLAKVSLLAYIKNRFGITMQETVLSQYSRIKKLAEFLKTNRNEEESSAESASDWRSILAQSGGSIMLHKSRFPHITVKRMLSFLIKLIVRIRTKGLERLPVSPYILAPNHQSHLDWLILATSLSDDIMRKTYIFAKEKHFKQRWRRWMADRSNIIIMDIHRDLNESIQKMAEVLKSGNNLVVFPEGTRSKDGSLGSFKKSFAILARELNVPV
ncbi:MAG: AMP-binding protein, partial [Spirochaetota bacterium]